MIKQCAKCIYYAGRNKDHIYCTKKGDISIIEDNDSVMCMDIKQKAESKEPLDIYDIVEQLTCNLGGAHSCWVGNAIKHIYNYNQSQTLSEIEAAIEILQEYVDTIRGR